MKRRPTGKQTVAKVPHSPASLLDKAPKVNRTGTTHREKLKSLLASRVSGASLAVFRMAVGLVMALEAFALLQPSASTAGKVMLETYYTGQATKFHLPYAWFEWLPVFPGPWMYGVVIVLGIASMTMALGLFYRASVLLVFLAWGYLYAVESTRTYWMSYYYLELLVLFLLIWMPATRVYSLDARIWKKDSADRTVPFWTIFLLRGQLVVAYFYAGVAKLNADWLLDAVPVRNFLVTAGLTDHPEWLAYFISYAGALFDLLIGFLLLARRTRILGLVLLVLFHATNHFILFDDIIWFPLLGVTTATIFLAPDWPETFVRRLRGERHAKTNGLDIDGHKTSRSYVVWFAVGWLGLQILIPIRHFLIPGDGRFTWEGLSFSWRLKTEVYSALPCEIFVHDPALFSKDESGRTRIEWKDWEGERVLYRSIDPGQLDWGKLPEVVILFEPELGERILYNPYASNGTPRTAAEARERLEQIWRQTYGRPPESVHKTIPLSEIVDGYATALRARGQDVPQSKGDILGRLLQVHGREGNGQMIPVLRRMHPFGLRDSRSTGAPFLLVEDLLESNEVTRLPRVNRALWREPMVILTALNVFERGMLPQAVLFDSGGGRPVISWDYLRDLSPSKGMHISTQPFLLKRYAEYVATEWERRYGRRPEVRAKTAVSLNTRPHQELVDPEADLAGVSVKHFGHNEWIRDLELKRIPRD